jgi:hypothetical protein
LAGKDKSPSLQQQDEATTPSIIFLLLYRILKTINKEV